METTFDHANPFVPSTTSTRTTTSTSGKPSKARRRAGYVLGVVPTLFMLFDATIKLANADAVTLAMARLGYPAHLSRGLGLLELVLVVLYLVPRAAVLGALLFTGYLGGAISTHLRIGDPFWSHTFFPVYVAAAIWGSLALRDRRLAAFLPWRSAGAK
jgi:hypothetical protein